MASVLAERQRHLVRLAAADVDRATAKTFKVIMYPTYLHRNAAYVTEFVCPSFVLATGGHTYKTGYQRINSFLLLVTPRETAG